MLEDVETVDLTKKLPVGMPYGQEQHCKPQVIQQERRQEIEDKFEAAAPTIGNSEEEQIKEVFYADPKSYASDTEKTNNDGKDNVEAAAQFIKPRRCRSRMSYQ